MSVTILGKEYNIETTENLDLSNVNLIIIPDEVFSLVNLKKLRIQNANLTSISPKIIKLKKLKNLWLDCNQIVEIPIEICELTKLRTLYLNCNKIQYIPIEISKFNRTHIYFYYNNIKKIPIELLNNYLSFDNTSYDIDNLDIDCEFLVFDWLSCDLTNLPSNIKRIYFKKECRGRLKLYKIKQPYNCEIDFF